MDAHAKGERTRSLAGRRKVGGGINHKQNKYICKKERHVRKDGVMKMGRERERPIGGPRPRKIGLPASEDVSQSSEIPFSVLKSCCFIFMSFFFF